MIDISEYSYDEWIKFTFAHPITSEEWYFNTSWEYKCDHCRVIQYLTTLFRNPQKIVEEYFEEQINQAFWFIPSAYGYMLYLLDDDIPYEIRKDCIMANYDLFLKLFAKYNIPGSADIAWWDSVFTYGIYENQAGKDKTFYDSPMLLQLMNNVIEKIATINTPNVALSIQVARDKISLQTQI